MNTQLKLSNLSVDEILKIVEPIMDNCLEGSNEGNYEKHTRDFTDRIKSIVTPEELQRQLEELENKKPSTRIIVKEVKVDKKGRKL